MFDQLLLNIQRMPSLLLGFLIILAVVIGLRLFDPPKTLCDVQMEVVTKKLNEKVYVDASDGTYNKGIAAALDFCITTNSPGGCYDIFKRIETLEDAVGTLPDECGQHDSTERVGKDLEIVLGLFAKIAWGAEPPKSKYDKTSWLDDSDLGLFCRLKHQYQRLYGKERWEAFLWSTAAKMPGITGLEKKDLWEKFLFSYPCKGLY